jgi:glycerate 2-kinase
MPLGLKFMIEIKNYKQVARTKLRAAALDILIAGIESSFPHNFMSKYISYKDNKIKINNDEFNLRGNLYVIGGGKASGFMAQELEKIIPLEKITAGIVNSVKKVECKKIRVNVASHPKPNEEGLKGVKEMLKLTSNLKEEDIVICLISGGGSSILPLPAEGITLDDKIKITDILLKCGADHHEINTIRKALSAIKGGRLAKILQPTRVITIILSDDSSQKGDVASRPTSPDEDSFEDAYRILNKYNIINKIPENTLLHIQKGMRGELQSSVGFTDKIWERVHNYTLAGNKVSLQTMKKKAEEMGFKTILHEETLEGEISQACENMHKILDNEFLSQAGPVAFIHGSEITVNVRGHGKGGRNQEFVLRMMEKLKGNRMVIAALGSDGVDFIEGVGGAIADENSFSAMSELGLNYESYIKNNNSYEINKLLGNLVEMSPTGTNVGDLHIYLKE